MTASRPASALAGWLAGRSLRGRLIAGLVALLALACAAVGAFTYLSLRSVLFRQLDQQLAAASNRYLSCVQGSAQPPPPGGQGQSPQGGTGRPPPCYTIAGQAAGTFSAELVSYRVTSSYITTRGRCDLSAADAAVVAGLPVNGPATDRNLPSAHGQYRLEAVRSPDGDVLVSGLPLRTTSDTLRDVALVEVIVFSGALLLAGVIGTGWVRLSLRPLRRMTATAADVTALPLASGEVVLPHRAPDDDPRTEVGQLGAAFNRMLGHVEAALARRHASEARLRRFAADASHELRTPLAAIRGYAELARHHRGPVPDEVGHALSRVEAESARMGAIVDDLLLLARLDAGRPLAAEPVDLTRLAIDAAADARAAGPDHRWLLELPADPVLVRGDEGRLRQVLANVLSNARMHTAAGTAVTVAVTGAAAPGAAVRLTVTDTGPGIPAELQADLFGRFVRGDDSRSRVSGGTGLGLAIVQAVVEAHRGAVRVSSEPGRTEFEIRLPGYP